MTRPNWPTIATPDGRRVWSFVAIWLGCVVFTVLAAAAMWTVRKDIRATLILGLAAHVQLLLGMGTFAFILGRRMRFRGGRDGIEIDDAAAGADLAAQAAKTVAEELKP